MTRARDVANLIGSGNYSSTTFTATAGQTAFTISHTQGFVQVFMNGLLLDETVDYTSNGSAVTLTSGAAAGDEIEVVKYNTFSVGDAIPASGGTFTGNVGFGAAPTRQVHIAGNPSIMLMEDTGGGTNDKKAQLQVDSGVFEVNSRNDDNSSLKDNILTAQLDTGNIGIGELNPQAPLEVNGIAMMDSARLTSNSGASYWDIRRDTSTGNLVVKDDGLGDVLTIDQSAGNILIGIASSPSAGSGGSAFKVDSNGRRNLFLSTASSNNQGLIYFLNPNGEVGSITTNGSATAYNTSSDYRLKENVTNISDGITRVKQLSPKRFNFIADADTTVDGFLAHETQTVVPEAITGTKDEVDDNGDAVMQVIDQSKLVPLLTAALQEAIAKIETLETKVAALEGG